MVSFFVPGIPVPKGSARAFYIKKLNRTVVTQTNADKQKPWASLISLKAEEAHVILDSGPVSVKIAFYFPRPKSHYGTGRNAGLLKDSAPRNHVSKPDLDKLVRCVLDALTSVAYYDDSQVVEVRARKEFGVHPGAEIEVK